jgi:glycosyltransferase involved in cell wall biosynthesis
LELRKHARHPKNINSYTRLKNGLKILQINASYKPAYIYGGPTMSVSKLCEQMVKAGFVIEVFTTTANGPVELSVIPNKQTMVDGVAVTYFKRLTKDHSHFSPALLRRLWKDVKSFDLVHIHAWWNLVSVLSGWIALVRGIPVIVSPRGTLSSYSFTNKNNLPKKIIHGLLGKGLLKRSYIHVTSGREKAGIETLIHPKSITVIPNFIALPEPVTDIQPKQDDHFKLIFFSRIEEKKGLDILLNALTAITVPYHLTIAGDGNADYIDQLKAIAAVNGLAGRISWIGFQGANKFDLLQQHDLMILPSYDENFGNVVIESLSVGTAVLISKNVGLADYVAENNLGWICELVEGDISSRLNNIADSKDKLSAIRKHAPVLIRIDFNEAPLTEKYINMYHQIINND